MCNQYISDSCYNCDKNHYISGKTYNFSCCLFIKAIKQELLQEPKAFHHQHELYLAIFSNFKNYSEEKNKEKMSSTEVSVLHLFCWKTYKTTSYFF